MRTLKSTIGSFGAFAVLAGAALVGSGSRAAQADSLIPSLVSVTPDGFGAYDWDYDLHLTSDEILDVDKTWTPDPGFPDGHFWTLYDFNGFISVVSVPNADWVPSVQGTGLTPEGTAPTDKPTIPNITFTWVGKADVPGPADIGNFVVKSSQHIIKHLGSSFTGQATDITDPSNRLANLGKVDAPAPVPEPTTLMLLGSGFLSLGVAARRRRKLSQ